MLTNVQGALEDRSDTTAKNSAHGRVPGACDARDNTGRSDGGFLPGADVHCDTNNSVKNVSNADPVFAINRVDGGRNSDGGNFRSDQGPSSGFGNRTKPGRTSTRSGLRPSSHSDCNAAHTSSKIRSFAIRRSRSRRTQRRSSSGVVGTCKAFLPRC